MAVNVGILGFAHGHVGGYGKVWMSNPDMGVSLVAGWDHDAERLDKNAENFRIEKENTAQSLVSRKDIQAVVISSETSMHADLVELAAAAGKNIILYKPIALNMAQADRIVEAVKKHSVRFSMGWQMRVDPQNIKMKQMLTSGQIGKVFQVRRRHGLSLHLNPGFADTWHANPEYNRDIWADDASHPIDFIYWLLGKPESVTAEISSLGNPRVPNDNGIAIFRYPDGKIAEVVCSFTCSAAESTTEIYAEKGAILQYFGDNPGTRLPHSEKGLKWFIEGGKDWIDSGIPSPVSHGERISGQAKPLADFLNGKREAIATAEEGREALRMLLACYVSTCSGRRVMLDDTEIDNII